MQKVKSIALIAHDNLKQELVDFVAHHVDYFSDKTIYATGTTAARLRALNLTINAVESGPKGGDLQIGSLIVEDKITALIFFWDPLSPHPHDVDVKALLRVAVLKNILLACNQGTAEELISAR